MGSQCSKNIISVTINHKLTYILRDILNKFIKFLRGTFSKYFLNDSTAILRLYKINHIGNFG
jgi:hypothetical protein